jgi:glucose-6-phosphate dehydrogenase assembly protein OpcA
MKELYITKPHRDPKAQAHQSNAKTSLTAAKNKHLPSVTLVGMLANACHSQPLRRQKLEDYCLRLTGEKYKTLSEKQTKAKTFVGEWLKW